ncbi:MAG: glycosyltransferase [Rhodobacteraceae bacterium]|nr:glycosyltransferase [Paracoccaceae bacterium]
MDKHPLTRTLFILDELYPADRGGIGRLMFNIVQHAKQENPALDLHILLGRPKPADAEPLAQALAGAANVHYLDDTKKVSEWLGIADIAKSIATNPSLNQPFQSGLRVLASALSVQEKVGKFDHIEIPDHMGMGAVMLMAREAGLAFQEAEITCRLHSSLSAILSVEPFFHARSDWIAPRVEFERYSLQHADRIVAHLPAIAAFNHTHFGFGPAWMDKVEVAFPPAIWPIEPQAPNLLPDAPDFIFTSRFQPFKRPDLFIKAAITFLDQSPDYAGKFRLISYGFNAEYIDGLRLMVPERFLNRVTFEVDLSSEKRAAAMAKAIIVQPSSFESLCALAYEVAANKNPILLAQDCAAFGGFDRWIDEENCLLFALTPAALANTMRKAINWQPSQRVNTTSDPAYFALPAHRAPQPAGSKSATVLVGPLQSDEDFEAYRNFAAQTGISAFGFAAAQYKRAGFDTVKWLSEGDYQGAQLRDLAQAFALVVLASPRALPSAEFMVAGTKCVRPGRAFSSNSKTPEQLNIYSGKMLSLLASDHRPCPPCLMLHPDDLDLIAPDDDHDIILRMLARLAESPVELVLSPLPLVLEPAPLAAQKPDRRLLGYDRSGHWQNGIRKIAVDVKTARHTPLLKEQKATVSTVADLSALSISAGTPTVISLDFNQHFYGEIIGIKIVNTTNTPVTVSLHRGDVDAALSAHNNGKQHRKFARKQGYIARWGTNWGSGKRVLVASASADAVLEIERFTLFSRE